MNFFQSIRGRLRLFLYKYTAIVGRCQSVQENLRFFQKKIPPMERKGVGGDFVFVGSAGGASRQSRQSRRQLLQPPAAPSRGSWLWVSCITANPAGVEGQLLQPLGSSLKREPGTNRLMENGSLSTAYGTPSAYGFFLYQTVPVVPIKRLPREGAGFGLVASLRTRRVLKVNSYSLSAAPSRGSRVPIDSWKTEVYLRPMVPLRPMDFFFTKLSRWYR